MKRNFLALAKKAAALADSKKAVDIVLLNVQDLTTEATYVVIASVESTPQAHAVRHAITQTIKDDEGLLPLHCDGRASVSWHVIDYGGLLIHIMSPRAREHYNIDKRYAGGRKLKI